MRQEALTHLRAQAPGRLHDTTLTSERKALAHHQSEIARMKAERMRNELFPLEEIVTEIEAEYSTIREKLLSLPAISAALVGGTRAEIEGVIREKINETLRELSEPYELVQRQRATAGDGRGNGRTGNAILSSH